MINVLLVDDNPDDRILATHELNRIFNGLQVREVSSSADLRQAIEIGGFDIVITDYQLHWTNGLDVLKRVLERYPLCPVIMLTGSGDEEIAVEGMKLGLSDYVLKGQRLHRLPVAIRESLEKAKLRRQYEETVIQLRVSEERYRLISDLISDFAYAYRIEPDGMPVREWTTEAFVRITGYELNEIDLRGGWQALVSPEDIPIVIQRYLRLMAGEANVSEFRIVTQSGDVRWLRNFARPLWDETERRVTFIYGAAQDITAQKQAEAERELLLHREQQARAEAETAKQRSLFLAEASQLFSTSLDYRTTLARVAQLAVPKLADWCFIDIAEDNITTLGEPVTAAADPAKRDAVLELRRRYPTPITQEYGPAKVLRTGKPELVSDVPMSLITAIAQDEEHLRLLQQLQPRTYITAPLIARDRTLGCITLASAQPDCCYQTADLEMALELARRAAIAIDNARLYQDAQEANRLKDEFLAIVSHELRTPLNSILGWAQMMFSHKLDAEMTHKALKIIERNAKSQAKLIDDILDTSRIIQNKIYLNLELIHLVPIINTIIEDARPLADSQQVRLKLALDPAVEPIEGDSQRLQQVIWNLLSNAIKFTPQGGQVELRLEQIDTVAQITVKDTGQGIDPKFLPHIFERFRQAEGATTRSYGGLGLGLSIVHHLVALHHGSVQAHSEGVGKGSVFTVQLPIQVATTPVLPPEPAIASTPLSKLQDVRVLVVDDDEDTLELATIILEEFQAEVKTANSVAAALQILSSYRPDVLISDIGMPGEDGYALIRQVKRMEQEQGWRVAAIALTAFTHQEERARVLQAGFARHIPKPVEPEELVEIVAQLTGR